MFKATNSVLRFGSRAFQVPVSSSPKPLYSSRSRLPSLRPQLPLQVARFASKSEDPPPPRQPIDREAELKVAHQKLEPRPSEVSVDSSTTRAWDSTIPVMTSPGTSGESSMNAGLQHDINIVKDTFSLEKVPREANALGLAGTIPYMATSLSTVFLAWDLGKELPTGNSLYDAVFINHDTAQRLLDLLQPIQLGYGAVIISFLGAIHWGLEFAEKQPLQKRTRFRYGMGLAASIVAWPTLFMPFEYALTTQWAAFVALYFGDARATRIGWAPRWYGVYRFLLTAIVGFAILISLVGRATMSQHGRLTKEGISTSLSSPGLADTHTNWAALEKKEKEKLKKEKEEAEKKAKKEAAEKKKEEKKNKGQGKDNAKGGEQAAENKDKSEDSDKKEDKADKQDKKEDDADKQDKKEDEADKQDKKDDKGEDASKQENSDEKSDEKEEDKSEGDEASKQDSQEKDDSQAESKDDSEDKAKDESEDKGDKDKSQAEDEQGDDNDKESKEKSSEKKGKKDKKDKK